MLKTQGGAYNGGDNAYLYNANNQNNGKVYSDNGSRSDNGNYPNNQQFYSHA